jgi:hypothetical protein
VNPIFARLDIPADLDTLDGVRRLISLRVTETRHMDFKRQVNDVDELAEDLCALANS